MQSARMQYRRRRPNEPVQLENDNKASPNCHAMASARAFSYTRFPSGQHGLGESRERGAVNTASPVEDEIAMRLVSAKVGPYKSIDTPVEVPIEKGVTVLVGMNESGKTVFLEALQKSDDIFDRAKFGPIDDYPRKHLTTYERRHDKNPDTVTILTFQITDDEAASINETLNTQLPNDFQFSITSDYQNHATISLEADGKSVIAALARGGVSTDFRDAITKLSSIGEIPKAVESLSLTESDKQHLQSINQRIEAATKANWGADVVSYEVFQQLNFRTPKFMFLETTKFSLAK
jgi:hypothetical protein